MFDIARAAKILCQKIENSVVLNLKILRAIFVNSVHSSKPFFPIQNYLVLLYDLVCP